MAEIIKSNAELEESLNAPAEDIVGEGVVLGDGEGGTDGEGSGTEPTTDPAIGGEGEGEGTGTEGGEGTTEEEEIEWSGENAARARHGWGDTKGRWYDQYTPEKAEEEEEEEAASGEGEGGDPASTDGEGTEEATEEKKHWYDPLVAPRPQVYHRKAKKSLFEHLYPDLVEEEGGGEEGTDPTTDGGNTDPTDPSTDPTTDPTVDPENPTNPTDPSTDPTTDPTNP